MLGEVLVMGFGDGFWGPGDGVLVEVLFRCWRAIVGTCFAIWGLCWCIFFWGGGKDVIIICFGSQGPFFEECRSDLEPGLVSDLKQPVEST